MRLANYSVDQNIWDVELGRGEIIRLDDTGIYAKFEDDNREYFFSYDEIKKDFKDNEDVESQIYSATYAAAYLASYRDRPDPNLKSSIREQAKNYAIHVARIAVEDFRSQFEKKDG